MRRFERDGKESAPGTVTEESESPATRSSLLSGLRDPSGDESWKRFFVTYSKLIYSAAGKRGLSDLEAQEVVQETMITVSRQMATFRYDRQRGTFKGWLMRLTECKIIDQFRKRKAEANLKRALTSQEAIEFQEEWESDWKVNLLEEAIERVRNRSSARNFQAYSTAIIQGKGIRLTANMLGMSRPAIHMAIFKVRRLIKQELVRLDRGE